MTHAVADAEHWTGQGSGSAWAEALAVDPMGMRRRRERRVSSAISVMGEMISFAVIKESKSKSNSGLSIPTWNMNIDR